MSSSSIGRKGRMRNGAEEVSLGGERNRKPFSSFVVFSCSIDASEQARAEVFAKLALFFSSAKTNSKTPSLSLSRALFLRLLHLKPPSTMLLRAPTKPFACSRRPKRAQRVAVVITRAKKGGGGRSDVVDGEGFLFLLQSRATPRVFSLPSP